MAYSGYTKRNGKSYGPYYYKSYRKNGVVKKIYMGRKPPEKRVLPHKSLLPFAIFFIALGILIGFLLFTQPTGRVTLQIQSTYVMGAPLSGQATITLQEGDSIQKDTRLNLVLLKDDVIIFETTKTLEEFLEGQIEYIQDTKESVSCVNITISSEQEVCEDFAEPETIEEVCTLSPEEVCHDEERENGTIGVCEIEEVQVCENVTTPGEISIVCSNQTVESVEENCTTTTITDYYYQTSGSYPRNLSDLIYYRLTDFGNYKLSFSIPSMNVGDESTFNVVPEAGNETESFVPINETILNQTLINQTIPIANFTNVTLVNMTAQEVNMSMLGFEKNDVLEFRYSDVGLTYSCSYYWAKNPSELAVSAKSDKNKLKIKDFVNKKGKIKKGTDKWEVLDSESGEYVAVEKKEKGLEFLPGEQKSIRFCAEHSFATGADADGAAAKVEIDHIPQFMGFDYNEMAWWNASWNYKKPITVTTTTNVADYQIFVNVTYVAGNMNSTFLDIRFTNAAENTELPYWISNYTTSSSAETWVKGNFTTGGGTQMYMYYGNPAASSASSSYRTFSAIENTSWRYGGAVDIRNDEIVFVSYLWYTEGTALLRRIDSSGAVTFSTDMVSHAHTDAAWDTTQGYIAPPRWTSFSPYPGPEGTGWFLQKWNSTNALVINSTLLTGTRKYLQAVATDSANNILLGGESNSYGPYLEKRNSTGGLLWSYSDTTGGDWYPEYADVAVDKSDNIIAGGRVQWSGGSGYQARLRKLNSTGSSLWTVDPYGNIKSYIYSLAVNNESSVLISLMNYSASPYLYDMKLYNSTGSLVWTKQKFDSNTLSSWPYNNGVVSVGRNFLVGGLSTSNKPVYYLINASDGGILRKMLLSDVPENSAVTAIKYDTVKNNTLIAIQVNSTGTNHALFMKHKFLEPEPTASFGSEVLQTLDVSLTVSPAIAATGRNVSATGSVKYMNGNAIADNPLYIYLNNSLLNGSNLVAESSLSPSWLNLGWAYRRTLNITNNNATEALANYSVLIDPAFYNTTGLVLSTHFSEGDGSVASDTSGQNNKGTHYGNTVGLWHFDENTSTTAYDASPYGKNGMVRNASWTSGKSGSALSFNGINSSVTTSLSTNYPEITMLAWVYVNPNAGDADMIGCRGSTGSGYNGYSIEYRTQNYSYFQFGYGGSAPFANSYALHEGVWTFIAGVKQGDTLYYYINGILNNSASAGGRAPNGNPLNFTIGGSPISYSPMNYFNGSIDEVAVYNKSLSANEILAIYNASKAKFTDWTDGKFGKAISFDGVNDYTNLTDIDLPATFSFSLWAKPNSILNGPMIINKDRDTARGWYLSLQADGRVLASSATSTPQYTQYWTGAGVISNTTSQWNHIVVTYDGSLGADQKFKFYVDGVNKPAVHLSTYDVGGTPANTNTPVRFGVWGDVNSNWFNGTIDEVRIYNRTLSAGEASELYNATKANLDYGDVRFAQNKTELGYWMEQDNKFWFKVPSVSAGGTAGVQMYYGNPSASSASNSTNTFIKFYDFENTLDGYSAGTTTTAQKLTGLYSYLPPVGSYGSRTTDIQTRPYIWEISYFAPTGSTGDIYDGGYGLSATNGILFNLGYPTALKWGYYEGTTWVNSGIQPTFGVWHTFKLVVRSDNLYDLYSDSDIIGIGKASSYGPEQIIRHYLYTGKLLYLDAERVRSYISPEPTVTIGSEQSRLQTNGAGDFSYIFAAPSTAGTYPIKVNSTYQGLYGENQTNLTVKTAATYTTFTGSTTDFNSVPDITSVSQPILENPIYGKIKWAGTVNAEGANFDNNINISQNLVKVNRSGLHSSFNSSANITLYGLSFVDPVPYYDPEDDGTFVGCPSSICQEISYVGNNYTFSVTGFSGYGAGEGATITTALSLATRVVGRNVSVFGDLNMTNGSAIPNNPIGIYVNNSLLSASNLVSAGSHSPDWWNFNWLYRKAFTVTNNNATEALANYSVSIDPALYNTTGLLLSTHFTEGDGYVAGDSSGQKNQGTHYGNTRGLWYFDENIGATAYDASTYGNNGAITGATWTTGKSNAGLNFNGSTDYVALPNDAYDADSKGTVMGWVYPKKGETNFFGVGPTSGTPYIYMPVTTDCSGYGVVSPCMSFQFYQGASNRYYIFTNISVPFNQWTHVAYVGDGTTTRVYINGVEDTKYFIGGAGYSRGWWFDDFATGTTQYTIGAHRYGAGTSTYFNGTIDEVALYNKPLTSAEISSNYNATKAKFADWTTSGKPGNAMTFDGVNDYIYASSTPTIDGGLQQTYSAWVYPTSEAADADYKAILLAGDGTTPRWQDQQCRLLYINPAGATTSKFYIDCGLNNNGNYMQRYTSNTYAINNWYHVVAAVFNGTAHMYVNGVLDDGTSAGNTGDINTNAFNQMSIGALVNSSNPFRAAFFNGTIDEVRIYNRSLSAGEISELYNATKARLDYGDVRFAQNSTALNYWMEQDNKFWFKVPSVSAGGTAGVQMYYGNPSANTTSNAASTFMAYADFDSDEGFGWVDNDVNEAYRNNAGYIRSNLNRIDYVSFPAYNKNSVLKAYPQNYFTGDYAVEYKFRDAGTGGSMSWFFLGLSNTNFSHSAADPIGAGNSTWVQLAAGSSGSYPYAQAGVEYIHNGVRTYNETSTNYSYNTDYYGRLERVGTTEKSRVFTDSARTTEVTGSPRTLSNLVRDSFTYLYPIVGSPAGASSRSMTGWIDDFRVRSFMSPEPTTTTSLEVRLLQTNGNGKYNYTFTAPSTKDSYVVKVNATYLGVYAENETTLTTRYGAIYSTFNGATTDFNNVPDISNVCQPILEKIGFGKIQWNGCVNAEGANFDSYVTLSSNLARVLSSGLHSSFNSSVNITLYGLSLVDPIPYYDPEDDGTFVGCPQSVCTKLGYSGGNFSFSATHFSGYSAGENITIGVALSSNSTPISSNVSVYGSLNFTNGTAIPNNLIGIYLDGTPMFNLTSTGKLNMSSADWWNGDWKYRKDFTLTNNNATEALANYSVSIDPALYNTTGLVLSTHFSEGDGSVASDTSGQNNKGTHYGNTVGLWHFDENTSTTAYDASPYGKNGTVNNASWVAGKSGSALNFNGVNSSVTTSMSINYPEITMAAWVYIDPKVAGNKFFGTLGAVSSGQNGYEFEYRTGNNSWFQLGAGGSSDVVTGVTPEGRWVHIVGVKKGTNLYIYVNGILNGTGTTARTPNSVQNVTFGRTAYTSSVEYFNGSIDEAAIYSRALSASEVLALYNATKAKFTDWTTGKFGNGLSFDGVNDNVTIPNSASLQLTNWTVSFWIYPIDNSTGGDFIILKEETGNGGPVEVWRQAGGSIFVQTEALISGWRYGNWQTAANAAPVNTWTKVDWVYSGNSGSSTDTKVYINGINVSTTFVQLNYATAKPLNYTSIPWRIGQDTGSRWFNGTIDEVRIYNRTLSAGEISELYSATKAKLDYSDVRFAQNKTELSYWMEQDDKFWFKVPSVSAGGTAGVQMYYGNPSANTTSNGDNAFLFFDDFNDDSYLSKWQMISYGDRIVESGGILTVRGLNVLGAHSILLSIANFSNSNGLIVEAKTQRSAGQDTDNIYLDSTTTNDYLRYRMSEYGAYYHINKGGDNFGDSTVRIGSSNNDWTVIECRLYSTNWNCSRGSSYGSWARTDNIILNADAGQYAYQTYLIGYGSTVWWSEIKYDYIKVRDYISPEPTATTGAEWQRTQTDSIGSYNYSFSAPATPGVYTIKANSIYLDVYAENQTSLTAFSGMLGAALSLNTIVTERNVTVYGKINLTDGRNVANNPIGIYVNNSLLNASNLVSAGSHSPDWWNFNWKYRKNFTITNNNATIALTNYSISIDPAVYNTTGLVLSTHFSEGDGSVASDTSGQNNKGTYYGNTVGLWHFDENTSTTAYDASSYGNNGTISGANWTTGKSYSGLSFDGVNDYASVPDANSLDISGSYSYEVWFKTNTTNNRVAMEKGTNALFILQPAGDALFYGHAPGKTATSPPIWDNQFHHLAIVYDSSSTAIKLYIDGSLFHNSTIIAPVPNANALYIGSRAGTQYFWNGTLDEFAVYSKALNASEVSAHYNAGKAKFTDWTASGKFGNAMSFDGVNDYVSTPISSSLTTFSVSAWININSFTGGASTNKDIIGKDVNTKRGWVLRVGVNYLIFEYNGAGVDTGTTVLSTNTWYYVTAVSNGTVIKVYLNGVLEFTASRTLLDNNGAYVSIGRRNYPGAEDYFNGTIDEVIIYNRSLSAGEISELYSATKARLDYGDVRFAQNKTELGYWMEQDNKFWVKVPSVAANGTTAVQTYYGNPSAETNSSAVNAFIREINGGQPVKGAWSMDETSGSIANDYSGNSNTGTAAGTLTVDGKFGKARNFSSSSDYVNVGNNASLQITQSLTISAWIYPTGLGTAQSMIVAKGDVTAASNSAFYFFLGRQAWPEHVTFGISAGSNNYGVDSADVISQNNWHHVVAVFDRNAKTLTTYVDGAQSGTPTSNVDVNINNVNYPVYIGRVWNAAYSGRGFRGTLDEVKIYNKALSADEVSDLYNNYGYNTVSYPGRVLVRSYVSPEPTAATGIESYYLQTNGDGNYNYTFLAPSVSGNYPIKVNMSYLGAYAENETNLSVKNAAIYNTFNGATTDFNSVPDITNVCQPILEKTGSGKIQWNNCVNAEAANFDSYVTLSSNLARVLSSGLHSSFNSSANVTLYGLTFKNPGILWDPEDDGTFTKCPDNICTKLSYASGNLLFNVTQFTGYSGGEAPNVTLISPADNTLTVNTTLTFVANITAATNLTNVSLWHNISGSWALNDTWYYGNLAPESSTVGLWHFDEGDGKTAADSALTNNGTHYGNTVMLLHLDENTSTTAYDASPYGNNGTLTNSPTWATGKSGSALNFKGSNDYVDLANNINFSGNTWTFAFWFNFGGANAAAIGDQGMIGKAGNTNTANDWWIERVRSGSTNNILRFQQISVNAWDASAVFTDNSGWHHAALVLNATNMTWYIDGVVNATFGAPPTLINSENLVLGYFWTTPGWRSYNGSIDEAAIYSRALSASEILVNYNAGKAKFTDWTNASKLGSYAMEFDGVNDYVKVSSLNPPIGGSTANLSVELWFSTKDVTTSCTTLFTRASDTLGWNEYCLICEDSKIQCSGYSTTEHMPDIKTSSTLEANKWYHFVYERDDTTKTRKLYLNGVRDDDGAGAYGGDQTAADDLYIGQNYNNEYYFNGTIDEVIIYNRSLSAAEIKALYQHKNYATSDSVNWAIDNIPVGTYNWNVQAFDSQGLDDWGDSNYSFRIYNTSLTDCRTIDASDTYILVNNVSSSGTCFTIAANDVTLDCQGYMINGTDAALSNGIDNTGGFDNITIKNCVIKDFDRGIYFINAENGTLANNSAYSNNRGIAFESSSNNILANNNVSSNANFGILLDSSSNGNTVTSNTANSIEWGIYISASSNGNTITNNNANSNTYDGIYLFSSSSNNLTNNTANSNSQYGIALESSSNNILQDNTANGPNQVRGIDINGGSGNNLTNNNATDNTLWDFYSKNNAAGNIVLNLSTQQNLVSFTSKDIALKGLSKFATPAFRSNATSTSGTANKPSGVVENDVLIAHIYTLGSSTYPTITPPSGWTSIRNMTYQYGDYINSAVYYKVANSSEPASYIWAVTDSFRINLAIAAFYNIDTLNPINAENGQVTPTETSHSTPSITTTVDNAMIVAMFGEPIGYIWTAPSGMSEIYNFNGPGGIPVGYPATTGDYALQAIAGATGAKTAASSGYTSSAAQIIALNPAPLQPADPANYKNIGKYINATNNTADSWLYLNISYNNATDIPTGVAESTLKIYRYLSSDSPVGLWHFDEGTGGIAYDSSSYGNNGTISGASWTTGKSNSGLSFDGSDDYVTIPDSPDFDFGTGDFAIEFWIYPTGVPNVIGEIINKADSTSYAPWRIVIEPDGNLEWLMADTGPSWQAYGGSWWGNPAYAPMNTWTHVVLTRSSGIAYLYTNGSLANSAPANFQVMQDANEVVLGMLLYYSTPYYYQGTIDNVILYNRSLSAEEVQEHYQGQSNIADWVLANTTSADNGVDTTAKIVYANITSFGSTFAPLGEVVVTNQAPQITFVQAISDVNPIEATSTAVQFNITVYDGDGFEDINDSSVRANFTKPGETLREDIACAQLVDYDTNYANYSCSIGMWYFDSEGFWNVSVYAEDNSGESALNDSTYFQYNQLQAIVISTPTVDFGNISTGLYNQTATSPTIINNTGNYNATGKIAINALDLLGEIISSEYISAGNFSVGVNSGGSPPAECSGDVLNNASDIFVSGIVLEAGNLSTGAAQEQINYCLLKVLGLSSQRYSTANSGGWTIKIT